MEAQTETASPTKSLDVDAIRSRIRELKDLRRTCQEDALGTPPLDFEASINQCALEIESRVKQLVSECSDLSGLGPEALNAFLEHLEEELAATEIEKSKTDNDIEILTESIMADSSALESDLEGMEYSLDLIRRQSLMKEKAGLDYQSSLENPNRCHNFEVLDLESRIEKKKMLLKSLHRIDSELKRYDAVEQIEDALTGLKVIEIDGSCIRLSLNTYIPKLESNRHNIEDATEIVELNHELLIEVVNGSFELKNVEIFPNDVDISDIIHGANSFRQTSSELTMPQTSLDWFLRKVQERVILSTMRRSAIKTASKSRHLMEYVDRDETIIAHMGNGIDAFIKLPQGWPLLNAALKLTSLQSSDRHSRTLSLCDLRSVEEAANSIDSQRRMNLSDFLDEVRKILGEMCSEGQMVH